MKKRQDTHSGLLHQEDETILESSEDKEKLISLLLSFSQEITTCRNRNEFLDIVKQKLREIFPYKEFFISLLNEDGSTYSAFLYNLTEESKKHPDYKEQSLEKYELDDGIYPDVLMSRGAYIFALEDVIKREYFPPYISFFYDKGIRLCIAVPLREKSREVGAIFIWFDQKYSFGEFLLEVAVDMCALISIAVSNINAYEKIERQLEEINHYKSQLEAENQYLQEQIKTVDTDIEMIGESKGLKNLLYMISCVADSDSTVLIMGETGTGKELVARAIHNLSSRKGKLMIKLNCAALPSSLIESELFGHERGSFTGAYERRIGKFELANKSTLFLDEIGELSLELQSKLLRAIQEKEIERVGGKEVIKTNVRIIAATNRDLQKEVDAGKFRADLYYRLNVFPLVVPSLRERSEDIPLLVSHFIAKLSNKLGKKIAGISEHLLQEMQEYCWPGNIRELEHLIERCMLLTKGLVIKEVFLPKNSSKATKPDLGGSELKSLEANERHHILAVLNKTNWKISGRGCAAEILGVPATTLHSRIKKLGIKKSDFPWMDK